MNQIKAILWKNVLINRRSKEYLRENISVLILGVLLYVVQSDSPNNFITPFYMAIAIFGYSRAVGLNWVNEKFDRHRQLQKVMGMKTSSYMIGWIIYFLLNGLLVSTIMLVIFKFTTSHEQFHYVEGYSFINVVIIYYLFMVSITGFVLTLSSLFTNPKNAAQGIIFIQLFLNMLYLLRISSDFASNRTWMLLLGIIPQNAFNLGLSAIAFQPSSLEYTYSDGILSLIVGSVVFFVLAVYLDYVMPNQYGSHRHPLFFLNCLKKDISRVPEERQSLIEEGVIHQQEPETSATYEQKINRKESPMIEMKNIIKTYDEKEVVSNVTMNFYSDQIFCLLGHNGAGKSTAINLLTGILQPKSGQIKLMGMKYSDNIDEIRKNIGVCLQFNVLYDELTVREHLYFFCVSKGISSELIPQQIQSIIQQCNLTNESQKLSKNLSGGNKRKLSLANALIGKSKYIFLDQPSSGLDPNSRQSIWGILKAIRSPNRCILLTTHHLQEAQQLSQRIGIMSYGKLVIIGDSQFIKSTFNVGYHITLNFSETADSSLINSTRETIKQYVANARQDEQTAINTVKFIVPENCVSVFPKLFAHLEKICDISLKMSSLEDSFVKLGEDQMNEGVLEEIAEMSLPNASCKYSFFKQCKAIFLRKKMTSFRSLPGIISVLLPCLFIGLGMIISCLVIEGDSDQEKAIRLYLLSFFFIWSFIFNTSSFCGDLVLERQKKFKYLSHVMGLKKLPYWTANYIFDYMLFIIPFSLFIILVFAFGERAEEIRDVLQYIIPVLLLFGFSFIGYSYMFSFMFQKSSTAFRLFPFFNLIFFYFIPTIIITIDPEGYQSLYIMPMVSPFICLSSTFLTPQVNHFMPNSNFQISYLLACFIVQGIVYLLGTLAIQNLRFKLKDRQNIGMQEEASENQINTELSDNDEVVVKNLYKKYSNGYLAIRNNSFSVREGEIFGLLGPNGAGKSTTFNIITSALSKTSGTVKILGEEVDQGLHDVFTDVGICPQYDTIYESMTAEEHLNYFAWIKGLEKQEINSTLNYYYKILALEKYIKIQAGKLSGGNKRKLVVSMAMLGNPRVMFFDEPSSGVDPISRRYLWKSFSTSTRNKNSSMILTTHTMNQAQSLCSRIGILIKGSFVALDTLSNLKKKYGKGYRACVKAPPQNHQQVKTIISQNFGLQNIKIEDLGDIQQKIILTISSDTFSYSNAFEVFEERLKGKGLISGYTISESTLQEIFLLLSEMQPEPDAVEYHEPWQFCCWQCGVNGCQCL